MDPRRVEVGIIELLVTTTFGMYEESEEVLDEVAP